MKTPSLPSCLGCLILSVTTVVRSEEVEDAAFRKVLANIARQGYEAADAMREVEV